MTLGNILKQILQQQKIVTPLYINMGLKIFQQTQIMQERKEETERYNRSENPIKQQSSYGRH
jgi:hypothetical protein